MNCRSCSQDRVISIISLGQLPLANNFLPQQCDLDEKRNNLEVMLCQNCGLAQLKDLISPKTLFSHYIYRSSYSDTMLFSAKQLVTRIIPTLKKKAFIVEIGSNDGYLLKNYKAFNISALGIDPAENIAKKANDMGIATLCDFFTEGLGRRLQSENKQADIIHANNVMAHVPDINDFIRGIKYLLKPHGIAIIEVPYFLDLVNDLKFDTIYHEHVYYFSVKSLKEAFERHSLEIFTIEKLMIHGVSLRLFISHQGKQLINPIVNTLIQKEVKQGLYKQDTYIQFMDRLSLLKKELVDYLSQLKQTGNCIVAYGASAKGTTLLNFFNIGSDLIDFIVDKSLQKQGLYAPGTYLPIKHPKVLLQEKIDYVLLLTWNFVEEILEQQQAFRKRGGQFIIPLPRVKTIT